MEKQIQRIAARPRLEKRKRVAAYARVSSGKVAMLHSLTQQVFARVARGASLNSVARWRNTTKGTE